MKTNLLLTICLFVLIQINAQTDPQQNVQQNQPNINQQQTEPSNIQQQPSKLEQEQQAQQAQQAQQQVEQEKIRLATEQQNRGKLTILYAYLYIFEHVHLDRLVAMC
jgi:hypothetical protein